MKYNEQALDEYAKSFASDYRGSRLFILCMLATIDVFGVLINIHLFVGMKSQEMHLIGKILIILMVLENLYAVYFFIKYKNYKRISVFDFYFGILGLSASLIFIVAAFMSIMKAYNYIPTGYFVAYCAIYIGLPYLYIYS